MSIILLSAANTAYAEDKEYSIIDALIDLTISNDGLLHVNESYTYSFDGTFNGVYRDIPLKDGESIDNLKVYIDGAYGSYEISEKNNKQQVKVYLWADEAHTQKIHDQKVKVTYSYDMKNVVTLFNDVGSLQYKLWGDDWDCNVKKLTANIHLPGDKNNLYYLNPEYYNLSDSMDGNTIHVETTSIPKGEFYELQVLMPLDDFSNATYAKHVNSNAKEQIMQKQADYKGSTSFWGNIFNALSVLFFISPLCLIFVYLKYGREPEVDYDGIYERELPTDDPPAVVNAIVNNKGDIGTPNLKGFEATIMDLIDRKIIGLNVESNEHTKDLILDLNTDRLNELSQSERSAFNLLAIFSDGKSLNLSRLSSTLNNEYNGKLFVEKFDEWKEDVKNEYMNDGRISRYFNDTGNSFKSVYSAFGIILAIIMFIISTVSNHPASTLTMIASVFLGVISFGITFLPADIFGQWTKEGRLYYLKWNNFKKFLSDNSLIKEHPPESIVIWNKYLVYGTALGVADKVYESMKLNMPNVYDDDYYYGDLYTFHSYSGLMLLNSAFNNGISAANPSSDGGSFGDIGGGSGGGGGGAF